MSNSNNRQLYIKPLYINQHVGGKIPPIDNTKYIKSQLENIKSSQDFIPPFKYTNNLSNNNGNSMHIPPSISHKITNTNMHSINTPKNVYPGDEEKNNRYDPYSGYLYKYGLLDNSRDKRRYVSNYINIDSRYRSQIPITYPDDPFLLSTNPLTFTDGSDVVHITHPSNNYKNGTLITIKGVTSSYSILRSQINNIPTIDIQHNTSVMKITGIQTSMPNLQVSLLGDTFKVLIQNIKGDTNNIDYWGNIPINLLNTTHSMYSNVQNLRDPITDILLSSPIYDYSIDSFFVFLPMALSVAYVMTNYNYKVTLLSLAGIPINLLNANYPLGIDQLQGYHIVQNVSDTGYDITVGSSAKTQLPSIPINGGGSGVYVAEINNIEAGYGNPNKYTIKLGKTYHDVISVKLVSLEFPNTNYSINNNINNSNNKLYWNNLDDGDFLYNIVVPSGNYNDNDLEITLQSLLKNIPIYNNDDTYTYNYDVSINKNTHVASITSYKQYTLPESIIETDPIILPNSTSIIPQPIRLIITNPNNIMQLPGSTIIISGAIDTLGIPASVINGSHIVSLIDPLNDTTLGNTFAIDLPLFNFLGSRLDTKGGMTIKIFIPNMFRLRFDFQDTLGTVLGWRDPGKPNSVTEYSTSLSNQDLYAFNITTDSFGNPITITNNILNLCGDNYVYMVANPINTYTSIGPIKQAFAKILLLDSPGKILFNNYVNINLVYDDPIFELTELEIAFYTQYGDLYNFNGAEHSFMLEIISVHDIPENTHISANTGKNYNM